MRAAIHHPSLTRYILRTQEGTKHHVFGVQVGRWAVRFAEEGHPKCVGGYLPEPEVAPWRIDHIPSGFVAAAFSTPEGAHGFADDISRFNTKDPASRDLRRALSQITPVIRAWAADTSVDNYIPFRQWYEEKMGEPWRPGLKLCG